jgi:hypothetical protein
MTLLLRPMGLPGILGRARSPRRECPLMHSEIERTDVYGGGGVRCVHSGRRDTLECGQFDIDIAASDQASRDTAQPGAFESSYLILAFADQTKRTLSAGVVNANPDRFSTVSERKLSVCGFQAPL